MLKKDLPVRRMQKRRVAVLLVMLVIMCGLTVFSAYRHFVTYPETVERDTVTAASKGLDFIGLEWDDSRNAEVYHVFYRESAKDDTDRTADFDEETIETGGLWLKTDTKESSVVIDGLKEGTSYSVVIRSDNDDYKGHCTQPRIFTTQKRQKIRIDSNLVKLTSSRPFMIKAEAKTDTTFESSDTDVIRVERNSGKAVVVGPGTADITIRAAESDQFTDAEKTVEIMVLDAKPVDISGSSARIIYHLSPDNCDAVLRVYGDGGATTPQGMAYTGDRYMIAFGMYGPTRIVSYDTDGSNRSVEVPHISLGHPNGFTYSPDSGLCYCVRGRSSVCVMYDTKNDSYSSRTMPVGCSGIAYDRVKKRLCTSARKSNVVYDPEDMSIIRRTGVVAHSGHVYRQDCECYDSLMMCCVSGSNKHGINYIDLYDMEHAKYIGSFSCDLSEVESAIVDEDGFLQILSNGTADYVWKTGINIKNLAKELH